MERDRRAFCRPSQAELSGAKNRDGVYLPKAQQADCRRKLQQSNQLEVDRAMRLSHVVMKDSLSLPREDLEEPLLCRHIRHQPGRDVGATAEKPRGKGETDKRHHRGEDSEE